MQLITGLQQLSSQAAIYRELIMIYGCGVAIRYMHSKCHLEPFHVNRDVNIHQTASLKRFGGCRYSGNHAKITKKQDSISPIRPINPG